MGTIRHTIKRLYTYPKTDIAYIRRANLRYKGHISRMIFRKVHLTYLQTGKLNRTSAFAIKYSSDQ